MVRQDFDTERLRTLRAELEQQTASLPAALQSSNAVGLVDHLNSIFKDEDWTAAAKCSRWSPDAQLAESSGWTAFQDLLRQDTHPREAEAELKAMDVALTQMHANLRNIQHTTCLPATRLAALASTINADSANTLDVVRCSVCHSLLLTAAFNDHLPSCRPCAPQSVKAIKSSTYQPGRAGGKAGPVVKGAKGSKKHKVRGSSKPPAGPSRFALEQAKSAAQHSNLTTTLPSCSDLHAAPHPSLSQPQAQPRLHPDPILNTSSRADAAWASTSLQQQSQQQTVFDRQQGSGPASTSGGELGHESHRMWRPRSAWTYEAGLSRSNPDMDAVHDPSLPPRFPQSVTRSRRKRPPSVEPGLQAGDGLQADDGTAFTGRHAKQLQQAASRSKTNSSSDKLAVNERLPQSDGQATASLLMPPQAKRQKQAARAQHDATEDAPDLWPHHQPPRSAGFSQGRMAEPPQFGGHAAQSSHRVPSSNQHLNGQHADDREEWHSMPHSSAAHAQKQRQAVRRVLSGQPVWTQGVPSGYQTQQLPAHTHRHTQSSSASQPAQTILPSVNGMHQQQNQHHQPTYLDQRPAHVPHVWSPVNGFRPVNSSGAAAAQRSRSGSWHMPESKRQVSVNALSRSAYGS